MGRIKNKKTIPLSLFFLQYFAGFFITILALIIVIALSFNLLIMNNMIYPANYAEKQANDVTEEIVEADIIREDMIPDLCQYAVFDKNGDFLSGNIEKRGVESAWKAVTDDVTVIGSYFNMIYYKVIPRDAEYCVLRYMIVPQYKSSILRQYLPAPQNLFFGSFIILTLLATIMTALFFGRALRRKLSPLIKATENIQKQELDFSILPSNIKEITTILKAMDDMRATLKDSLESQWKSEQNKKDQMSALAHDLKTPLTLVRGNAELLYDTELSEEQKECVDYIQQSSLQMQTYVQTLIEVTKSQTTLALRKQSIDAHLFFKELKSQVVGLCSVSHINLRWDCKCDKEKMIVEPSLLTRAMINVFTNAVDQTPSDGTIIFEFFHTKETLQFVITDTGSGFSQEAMSHGKEQFFMDDSSRTHNAHYGMGLYIVDTIVKQHNGTLTLGNSESTGGGRVVIQIPG